MHFFKNSVSFVAVLTVCGAALAAVAPARVGVVTNASAMRRLPTLANIAKSTPSVGTSTTTSSTGTGLIDDSECVDDYRDCMKGDNACGSDFEECTTNVLFHGRMSECASVLYQCSPSAIERLLGTNNLNALSDVNSYVDGTVKKDANGKIIEGEVARYTYPTDGSIMGTDIIGAAVRNKLNTSDCVKKYKRCLNKDDVCGSEFELCTSETEFKKQAAMCDSTLARCQKEGFQQLFGEATKTKPSNKQLANYEEGSDVKSWVEEGAALAAANAVNTCYKVVDNCFANACAQNPYSCVEDVDWSVVNSAQSIVVGGLNIDTVDTNRTGKQMATDVRKFFRAACTDTIGSNQYCFMTFNGGKKPTKADLKDEDLREDIFGDAYASRKTILTTKVNELVKQFDTKAREKCIETFKSCAVHSCGGGSGAACYQRVFGDNMDKSINTLKENVYEDIRAGCEAVVNTDANCRHMAAMQGADTYTFEMGGTIDTFGILFPKFDGSNNNAPIVSALNADLSTSYNAASIEQMKKQCSNVVTNCVKSMCGTDYKNCYRNRNDIRLNTYATNSNNFNKSMNRVGGVLDYTIVQGLCASTVKSADACAESLAIAKVGIKAGASDVTMGWGNVNKRGTTMSNEWRNSSANYGYNTTMSDTVPETDDQGRKLCKCQNGGKAVCDSEQGGVIGCSDVSMITRDVQLSNSAVNTLFQDVLADVELEAQAQYKAKLTKEQNICLAQNTGANPDATFVWAKLKNQNNKLGSDYSVNGLGDNGSVASNDLYDSFCRVKVTVQSEDKDIQSALSKGKATSRAYFAVGDPFTCGSWISGDTLDEISEAVTAKKTGTDKDGALTSGQKWGVAGMSALSGIAGIVGMDLLQSKTGLGGLLGTTTIKDNEETISDVVSLVSQAREKYNAALTDKKTSTMNAALSYARQAKSKLTAAGIDNTAVAKIVIPTSVSQDLVRGQVTREFVAESRTTKYTYGLNKTEYDAIAALISEMKGLCELGAPNVDKEDPAACRNHVGLAENLFNEISSETYTSAAPVADLATLQSYLNQAVADMKRFETFKNNKGKWSVAALPPAITSQEFNLYYELNGGKYILKDYRKISGQSWYSPTKYRTLPREVSAKQSGGYNEQKYVDFRNDVNALPNRISRLTLNSVESDAEEIVVPGQSEMRDPDSYEWNSSELQDLDKAIEALQNVCDSAANGTDKNFWNNGGGRAVMDVVGGGITATVGGITTAQIMKAKNRSDFTEAQQEWMENVGSKVHCYVGGRFIGDFGDIVSVDISED